MKFSKWNVEIFNGCYKKYGGHWLWLSKITGLDYLTIGFLEYNFTGYYHDWYDGQHHTLSLMRFRISWGGKPFIDI